METERRGFLKLVSKGTWAFCLGGIAILSERFIRPPRNLDLSRRLPLGPLSQLPPGASKHLKNHDVYLFHGPQGLYAMSGRCTHLGCSILRTPEGFSCPCHGAQFDLNGTPTSGPASSPLTWYKVIVDRKRNIWLHLDEQAKPGTWTRI